MLRGKAARSFTLNLAFIGIILVFGCKSHEDGDRTFEVSIVDSDGNPVPYVNVGLYENRMGVFFYEPEHVEQTDSLGVASFSLPRGDTEGWHLRAIRTSVPRLDSLAGGRALMLANPSLTSHVQLVVSEPEASAASLPGSWTRIEGGGAVGYIFRADGSYQQIFADSGEDTGKWSFEGASYGDHQGTLTLMPTGYIAAEYMLMDVTGRYLALFFQGETMSLYERN